MVTGEELEALERQAKQGLGHIVGEAGRGALVTGEGLKARGIASETGRGALVTGVGVKSN